MTPYYSDQDITIWNCDCREVLPTLAANSVDLVLTDPPYGHRNNDDDLIARWESALGRGPSGPARPIANDGAEANDLVRWLFPEAARLLKPGCCCCCCCGGGGGGPDPQFARWSLWMDAALEFKQMLIWDKGGLGMGWHYRRSYETVLVAQKPGAACRWYGGNRASNVLRVPKIIPGANDHPTPKPIALLATLVRYHTEPGDLVLDPFAGAGPTIEAARLLGRRCIAVEIDEQWCERAARRLAQPVLALDDEVPA